MKPPYIVFSRCHSQLHLGIFLFMGVCVCVTGHVAVDLSFLCQSFQLQANKSESYQFLCFTIKETIGASCLMTFQTTCKFNTGKPVCQ